MFLILAYAMAQGYPVHVILLRFPINETLQ